ncbi:MAG: hypothetical protein ACOY0R_10265 [Chloroflexota bacterium]
MDDFFSTNHKRLLELATWAKYLAWVALVIGVLGMAASALQTWNTHSFSQMMGVPRLTEDNFLALVRRDPQFAVDVFLRMVKALFGGVFYFVVLKGISLGLNMIVETDINYREKNFPGGAP